MMEETKEMKVPEDRKERKRLKGPEEKKTSEEMRLSLKDEEWPCTGVTHDREIVRAIVADDEGWFYFVRVRRDDEFGHATLIETSGGGVEPGEDLEEALRRELQEEMGAQVDVLRKIGIVSDYYNLIGRHNINHYYLCRVRGFGETHRTRDEIEDYHMTTLKLRFDEALREYRKSRRSRLGRLIANREVPVLQRAAELLRESVFEVKN